ncbi:MAG: three-Cys-motif partner protein TcmP [Synergistaceae bacterium]|nr:three-Cys-motif partner protein TcmP [Synergistaceae bacterium]
MSRETDGIIDEVSPHTVKKFELVEGYVRDWKEIMLNNSSCGELIFIDCMSNSGEYKHRETGETVYGTPVRINRLLREAASRYPRKNVSVIFNDKSAWKIAHLKALIPEGSGNYHVSFLNEDCNVLLRRLSHEVCGVRGKHSTILTRQLLTGML